MKQKKTSRKDVAKLAGVSEATVSYVINNTKNITPDVKERVQKAVKELNYTPNLIAKSLATQSTRHIALLIDNLKNPHFCELLEGAQSAASKNGYIVSVIAADTSNPSSIAELVGRGVDGIINSLRIINLDEILGVKIPSVCEGTHLKRDYYPAMSEAVRLLKEKGHRNIAYLSGIPVNIPGYGRVLSLKKSLEENDLPIDSTLFIENKSGYKTDEIAGMEMADKLIDSGKDFTAVIAVNDLVAIGAAKEFEKRGFKVPEDISIIGCDNIKILDYLTVSFSSIDTKAFETGEVLMRALMSEINGLEWTPPTFTCEFVNRESVCDAGNIRGI